MSIAPLLKRFNDAIEAQNPRSELHVLPGQKKKLSNLGFFLFVGILFVVGMVLLLVLNTEISARARQVSKLQNEASRLAYAEAPLISQVNSLRSAPELAKRAEKLGMVPNTHPVFLDLATGAVIGTPTKATGAELPEMMRAIRDAQSPLDPVVVTDQEEEQAGTTILPVEDPTVTQPAQQTPGEGTVAQNPTPAPPAQNQTPAQPGTNALNPATDQLVDANGNPIVRGGA